MTREQRRIENHERALGASLEHHAAAVALLSRIQGAIANHDLAPEPPRARRSRWDIPLRVVTFPGAASAASVPA